MAYIYNPYSGPHDNLFNMPETHHETMSMQSLKDYELRAKKEMQMEIGEKLSRKDSDEYGDEILNYMEEQELRCLPCVESIDMQHEIQWYMRPYLLDFLIEAHLAFNLEPETLFLAINILDRYCSKRVVYRKHYQLVGCTALLIAAKYGECSKKVPHIKELVMMCCKLYDEDMFVQMERHVMTTLDWFVGSPTIDYFLQMALDEESMPDLEVEHMAQYIAEIALFHREFVSKRPSDLAKSSLALARIVLGRQQPVDYSWSSSYDYETFFALSYKVRCPSSTHIQKYRSSRTSRVSETLENFLARHDAIAKYNMQAAVPPSPPAEHPSTCDQQAQPNMQGMHTPQKPPYNPNMPMTPPITPENENFVGYNNNHVRCAETPTPSSHSVIDHSHYRTSFYVPGIN